ncbi:MAG TPA: hypothetical protein VF995_11335 [Actinomycetota bacterium]
MRIIRGVGALALAALLTCASGFGAPARAQASSAPGRPVALLLFERLSWAEAAGAAAAAEQGGATVSAGLVSTLPADASLAARVASVLAGREVTRAGPVTDSTVVGGVPVQLVRDTEATHNQDELFVLNTLVEVLAKPRSGPLLVAGLVAPPGHARVAPFLELGSGGPAGVATSDSTRQRGLVAFQDLRATLTGTATDTDGAPIRVLADPHALQTISHLDHQAATLVATRTLAIPIFATLGTVAVAAALAALLLAWRWPLTHRGAPRQPGAQASMVPAAGPSPPNPPLPGWPGRARTLARVLLLLTFAVPAGYLLSSIVAPSSAAAWLTLGLATAAAFALAAAAAATAGRAPPGPGRAWDRAPALLGALLAALVVVDLLAGGHALGRPLLGNSIFDGERFYGLGNGYFANAFAGLLLLVAFAPVPALPSAGLFAAFAVIDGLPMLGADVGGALTAMVTAALALLLLSGRRPSARAVVAWVGLAVAAAVAVALGAALLDRQATHGSRFAHDLLHNPGAATRALGSQLHGNLPLLAGNFWAWWGPLLVLSAGLASRWPTPLLARVPQWVRQVALVGALGSAVLIVLNDTGVTAAAAPGLFLIGALGWSGLESAKPGESPTVSGRAARYALWLWHTLSAP